MKIFIEEELALLPADVQEALALGDAGFGGKTADELSKEAADATYEANKDGEKRHHALLAHAKAAAAHHAEAEGHRADARKADESKDYQTSSAHRDAAYKAEARARAETDMVVHHAAKMGHGTFTRYAAQDGAFVALRDWSDKKRKELKDGKLKGAFAGPDDSYPIASPEDVGAAADSLGRAGNKADIPGIKAKIISIAKEFGWEAGLPEDWKEKEAPAQNVAVFSATMDDLLGSIIDPAGQGLTAWLPVIYPGKYNDRQFTATMLKQMVETFNPKAESCPVKIGHEGADTQPQLSQIREVKLAPCTLTNGKTVDTCLWVRMDRTPEALASQRQYRKTSIEAWPPEHQSNPTPGKWNLKGLAFLGAAAPAVPGLPPTTLSATNPQGGNDMPLTPEEIAALQTKQEALTASLTASNQEALRLRREKDTLTAELAAQKKEAHASAIKTEIGKLSAKLLPAQMELAEAVALALDSDEPTVSLSGKETPVSARACFIALLEGFKDHGLTNPLNVPALSGKKTVKEGDDETLSDTDYAAKMTKEFKAKNPDKSTVEAIKYGQKCVKERAEKNNAKK